ncbi:MAG: DUF4136 domain-containing protein [Undibacterium sp.]|uniref:DUF4136 domain-containing protein n=1 Tax=Undibacterium sp. TaxID=1914977 RepID=UPI002727B712|nr:DUF4136 domain-containing protein [Undibacterium sp.]MDO8652386.1 DUF4136 domain-containing protein [Undibacterium sp.]
MKSQLINKLLLLLMPLALASGLLVLGGCASAPEVRTAFDRSIDFTQYKTFAFVSPLGTDRGDYQSIVSQELKAGTQREMEARGMRLVTAAPQLLVNFNAELNEKIRVTTRPGPTFGMGMGMGGGYYGYRTGIYSAWPLYADETIVSHYKEGTVNIDVVDAARKQLVWEAVVTGSVTDKDLNNIPAAINTAVLAAFARYPIPAPSK